MAGSAGHILPKENVDVWTAGIVAAQAGGGGEASRHRGARIFRARNRIAQSVVLRDNRLIGPIRPLRSETVQTTRATRLTCAVIVFLAVSTRLSAAPPLHIRSERANERIIAAAESGGRVKVEGLPLGDAELSTLELEPMKLWADDARILVDHGSSVDELPIPNVTYFRGKIAGDPASVVFITVSGNGVDGLAITGTNKRFKVATGRRQDAAASRRTDPLFVTELDEAAEAVQPENQWRCDVAKMKGGSEGALLSEASPFASAVTESGVTSAAMVAQPINVLATGTSFTARVDIDTDFELYSGFGSAGALTTYVSNLVGAASTIYQRDLNTTLILGTVRIRDTASDPWTKTPASNDTGQALAEFGTYYHNNYPLASNARSVAVLLSGKAWFGGVAWTGVIGNSDFFCGATGSGCGSSDYANQYGGSYAFVGTTSVIATTVPDPNATVNGIQYKLPNNNNYWMLLAFAHEVGHNVAADHTSCYQLSAAEKTQYGVTRDYIDNCLSGEGGCYSGTTSAPAELGTIMSYCHNIGLSSRFLFAKAGEASEKMFPVLLGGLDERTGGTEANGATAVGTITMASNLTCAAGQTASVQPCATGTSPVSRTCTYAWQITGGTINGSTTGTSISFTPNAANVTVTATLTNTNLMTMTVSKSATASCGAVVAPANVVATATSGTNVAVNWTASAGATSYKVYRKAAGGAFVQVGTPVTNSFSDTVPTGAAYLYKVTAVNGGSESSDSNSDFATAFSFTDPSLVALSTQIKAAHVSELRTAVAALRALAGLTVASYTDPSLTVGVTTCKRAHITELRSALDAARTALGGAAGSYTTDGTITAASTPMRTAHINELRNALQ